MKLAPQSRLPQSYPKSYPQKWWVTLIYPQLPWLKIIAYTQLTNFNNQSLIMIRQHAMTSALLSVNDACEKQLRDHELPTSIEGFLIVTESFSYLVDDLDWDQGDGKQASILLMDAKMSEYFAEREELQECFAGVALYQEWVEVTGLLRESGIGAFERQLYRIDQLTVLVENEDESISRIAINLP